MIYAAFKYFTLRTHSYEIDERMILISDQPSKQMVAPYVARERRLFSVCCSTRLTSSSSNLAYKILYPGAKEIVRTTSINSGNLTPLNAQPSQKNIVPTTCPNWIAITLQGPPRWSIVLQSVDRMV